MLPQVSSPGLGPGSVRLSCGRCPQPLGTEALVGTELAEPLPSPVSAHPAEASGPAPAVPSEELGSELSG